MAAEEDVALSEVERLRLTAAEQRIQIAQMQMHIAQRNHDDATREHARVHSEIEEHMREGGAYELLPGAPAGHVRRRRVGGHCIQGEGS